jgi:two-component system LytT family response regulator
MKIRTLIVDDEPLARDRLRKLLETEQDIEIAGECGDGRAALAAIKKHSPDLIFLDIQMPEFDGFEVLAKMKCEPTPAIIFVTAYDKFALQAFEVHALDYLLKPFDRERFHTALNRARAHLERSRADDLEQRLASLLTDLKEGAKTPDRLAVKSHGRILLLKLDEIDWIEAADNYVNLHVRNESHLMRETMTSLETRLDPRKFIRISRSAMVNVERIKEMQPLFHGDYVVILQNGTRLTLSRNHRAKLDQLLGKSG